MNGRSDTTQKPKPESSNQCPRQKKDRAIVFLEKLYVSPFPGLSSETLDQWHGHEPFEPNFRYHDESREL